MRKEIQTYNTKNIGKLTYNGFKFIQVSKKNIQYFGIH